MSDTEARITTLISSVPEIIDDTPDKTYRWDKRYRSLSRAEAAKIAPQIALLIDREVAAAVRAFAQSYYPAPPVTPRASDPEAVVGYIPAAVGWEWMNREQAEVEASRFSPQGRVFAVVEVPNA